MAASPPMKPDPELLPSGAAERLLARASELDSSSAQVAQLREAAKEAGISPAAFDAALEEYRAEKVAATPTVNEGSRQVRRFTMVLAAVILAGAIGLMTIRVFPSSKPVPAAATEAISEVTFSLKQLDANTAAELIRPVLDPRTGSLLISPGSPKVIRVRGTAQELTRARSVLDRCDGTAPCAIIPTPH